MHWLMLSLAIVTEVIATVSLRFSEGFSRPLPSIVTAVGYVVAFWCLSQALKAVPVSTAYAIWAGVGTATVAAIGVIVLGEPGSITKTLGIVLIIAGVVIVNAGGGAH